MENSFLIRISIRTLYKKEEGGMGWVGGIVNRFTYYA